MKFPPLCLLWVSLAKGPSPSSLVLAWRPSSLPQALSFGLILLIADPSGVELSVLQHTRHSHDSAGRPGLAVAIRAARAVRLPVVIASEDGQHAKSWREGGAHAWALAVTWNSMGHLHVV